jgi:hypothetical protein
MSRWAIIDIDGSISDCSRRNHLALAARNCRDPEERSKLWDQFHEQCSFDPPHEAEILLIKCWLAGRNQIVYVTGRSAKYRTETQRWLMSHGLPQTPIYMRDAGNFVNSLDYKAKQLESIKRFLLRPNDTISFVLEDNDRLVKMWRELGITCLQPRLSAY